MQVKNLVTLFLYYIQRCFLTPPPPTPRHLQHVRGFSIGPERIAYSTRGLQAITVCIYVYYKIYPQPIGNRWKAGTKYVYIAHCPLRFNQACSERSFFYIDFITLQQNKYVRKNVKSRYSRKQQTGRIDFLLCHLLNSWLSVPRKNKRKKSSLRVRYSFNLPSSVIL